MAEGNGNEARVAAHDGDLAGLRAVVRDLGDAMVVQDAIVESRERENRIDARIDKLVESIGKLIRRIPPENLRSS